MAQYVECDAAFACDFARGVTMRWPWRALVYAVVALCVVTGVFALERPWMGVGGLAVCAVAVLLWRVLRRYFSFK